MVTRANMYHAIMYMPSGSLLPASSSSSLNIDISEHSLHHSNLKGQLIVSLVLPLRQFLPMQGARGPQRGLICYFVYDFYLLQCLLVSLTSLEK